MYIIQILSLDYRELKIQYMWNFVFLRREYGQPNLYIINYILQPKFPIKDSVHT